MSSKICFFHTVSELTERFDKLAAEYVPNAEYFHIVDESTLRDALDAGGLTPSITSRICTQLSLAEDADADIVLDTCSSTSPTVDIARELVDIPIVKIDDPMTERAVELGEHVTVVATASSTLGPSTNLVERKADRTEKAVTVASQLVDGALEARESGDVAEHDRLIVECVVELASETDVVVLAQASMAHLEQDLTDRVDVSVLTSPKLAMETIAAEADRME